MHMDVDIVGFQQSTNNCVPEQVYHPEVATKYPCRKRQQYIYIYIYTHIIYICYMYIRTDAATHKHGDTPQ